MRITQTRVHYPPTTPTILDINIINYINSFKIMEKKNFFKMKSEKAQTQSVNRDSFASLKKGTYTFECEGFFIDEFPFSNGDGTWVGIVALSEGKAVRFGANAFFNALGIYTASEKDDFEKEHGESGFSREVTVTDDAKEWSEEIDYPEEEEEEEEVAPKKKSAKK